MADHDRDRFLALMEGIIGAWAYMQGLFEDLPLPVTLPAFEARDDEDGPATALLALNRVRQLIQDEPIPDRDKRAYEHMVLDWFAAYEMLVLTKMAGPAPWRLDVVEFAVNRFVTWVELIEEDEPDES
ncbi:hypothetical protein [Streptomyces sp. NPDC058335]|uniref:hypothetical protein n=1 Tax=Streptomyces sp. NPDC058335 TaxID=3346451 RepID=UPI00365EF9E5